MVYNDTPVEILRNLLLQEAWKDPAKREPMIGSIPLGKFAEPEDISDAVLFLLSDRAVS